MTVGVCFYDAVFGNKDLFVFWGPLEKSLALAVLPWGLGNLISLPDLFPGSAQLSLAPLPHDTCMHTTHLSSGIVKGMCLYHPEISRIKQKFT